MNQEKINKEYEKFLIPEESIPDYNGNPYDFVNGFKKFTLLKEVNTIYSDTSECSKNSEVTKIQDVDKLLIRN